MNKKQFTVLIAILASVYFLASASQQPSRSYHYHSGKRSIFSGPKLNTELPLGYNDFFSASGECGYCHGPDISGETNVDAAGNDVNPTSRWRSSMMANSAKDPYYRAKVEHEALLHPENAVELQTKCTTCHAPAGHFNAMYQGAASFTLADMENDAIAFDGVNCSGCHQIAGDSLGKVFSGDIRYDTLHYIFGPVENPISSVMTAATGFDAVYQPYFRDAALCASCHTLITETITPDGDPTGGHFVEQATYHEWLNSSYSNPDNGITCQGCHFPEVTDGVKIATPYSGFPLRSPIGLHDMVGGNVFILQMLRDNSEAIGVKATTDQLDSTIARTRRLLQQQTLDLEMEYLGIETDTALYALKITNKAGHKFPSGFPSRRAWIHLVVVTENGDTLMNSGRLNTDFTLAGLDAPFEPHHQVLRQSDDVQVYEQIMADVNGSVTTVLQHAAENIKDNRLVPAGFSSSHYSYDTVAVSGAALTDPDFNHEAGQEGSGTDRMTYHVALNGYSGLLNARAEVLYQSVTPEFVSDIFDASGTRIDAFETMFFDADNTPVTVAEAEINQFVVAVHEPQRSAPLPVYPNPTHNGWVYLPATDVSVGITGVFDASGRRVHPHIDRTGNALRVRLPDSPGLYFLQTLVDGESRITKVIRLP